MPNQPKTPITSYRLSDEDRERIARVAEAIGSSHTEAVRRLAEAATSTAESMLALRAVWNPEDFPRRLCRNGDGHTGHVWELTGAPPMEAGYYYCVGEPFSNGFDPADYA